MASVGGFAGLHPRLPPLGTLLITGGSVSSVHQKATVACASVSAHLSLAVRLKVRVIVQPLVISTCSDSTVTTPEAAEASSIPRMV